MNKDIFISIFGHINRDIILRVPKIPEKGSINVVRRDVCCGGTAYNMAIVASILGIPVSVYSSVGKDLKDCVENLAKVGVDTSGINIVDEDGPYCYIIDDGEEQIAAVYQGPMNAPKLRVEKIGEWAHFYTGPPEVYLEIAENIDAKISLDPGQEVYYRYDRKILEKFSRIAEILFCNRWEYEYMRKILDKLNFPAIIVTLGKDGCMLITKGKKIKIPSRKVENIVKTVGAGDAFRAGFYLALYKGYKYEEACRIAADTASKYIEGKLKGFPASSSF